MSDKEQKIYQVCFKKLNDLSNGKDVTQKFHLKMPDNFSIDDYVALPIYDPEKGVVWERSESISAEIQKNFNHSPEQEYIKAMEQIGFKHIYNLCFESPASDYFDTFYFEVMGSHIEVFSTSGFYDGYLIDRDHYEAFMMAMRLTHAFLWEKTKR